METRKTSHAPKRHIIIVLILPMRNGNILYMYLEILQLFVLILPMRNGNNTTLLYMHLEQPRSYPTYEEWKLKHSSLVKFNGQGSYPTYEEWKHSRNTANSSSVAPFLSYL